MKIIHEESVYLIPEDNNIVVLAGSEQKGLYKNSWGLDTL